MSGPGPSAVGHLSPPVFAFVTEPWVGRIARHLGDLNPQGSWRIETLDASPAGRVARLRWGSSSVVLKHYTLSQELLADYELLRWLDARACPVARALHLDLREHVLILEDAGPMSLAGLFALGEEVAWAMDRSLCALLSVDDACRSPLPSPRTNVARSIWRDTRACLELLQRDLRLLFPGREEQLLGSLLRALVPLVEAVASLPRLVTHPDPTPYHLIFGRRGALLVDIGPPDMLPMHLVVAGLLAEDALQEGSRPIARSQANLTLASRLPDPNSFERDLDRSDAVWRLLVAGRMAARGFPLHAEGPRPKPACLLGPLMKGQDTDPLLRELRERLHDCNPGAHS